MTRFITTSCSNSPPNDAILGVGLELELRLGSGLGLRLRLVLGLGIGLGLVLGLGLGIVGVTRCVNVFSMHMRHIIKHKPFHHEYDWIYAYLCGTPR